MSIKSIASDVRMTASPTQSITVTNALDGTTSGHADFVAPSGIYIRAVNISVAGLLLLLNIDGTSSAEYFNTGWNPCTLSTKILDDSGNTATVLKVGTTAVSVST